MNAFKSLYKKPRFRFFLYFIITFPGSILAAKVVQSNIWIKKFDEFLFLAIYNLPRPEWAKAIMWPFDLWFLKVSWLPHLLVYFYIWFILFLIGMFIFKRNKLLFSIGTLLIGFVLAGWLLGLDWKFAFRDRPFTQLPTELPEGTKRALSKWPSFPSGHVRDTALTATIMIHFLPRTVWVLAPFVLFIAFGRVYAGAHWPTDSIAGIVFGYLLARMAIIIVKQIDLYIKKRREKKKSL